ncbi:MAG: hypothetical protein QE271_03675 [Bacteriovoracaceae bacterium]|nr:hypothetical protein [Bacteriovoracaceae bacterium]
MEKDFSFLDDLQVIAEEDILDSGLDRERIWLVQTGEGTIFGPYMEDELRKISFEHGRTLNFCNACRLSDRQWKLFFDHPQFQRRVETPFPPLIPRHQENFEEFFVLHQGQKHGPYTPDAIQQMLIKKALNMQGLISADKGKTWKKVYHFEIFDRRRDGKYSVPSAVKSQTLSQIKKGMLDHDSESYSKSTPPMGGNLAEELTSTLMLGQKQMGPRSPRNINYQFQKEFRIQEDNKIGPISLDGWEKLIKKIKSQSPALLTMLGLGLLILVGKRMFPTDLSTSSPSPQNNFREISNTVDSDAPNAKSRSQSQSQSQISKGENHQKTKAPAHSPGVFDHAPVRPAASLENEIQDSGNGIPDYSPEVLTESEDNNISEEKKPKEANAANAAKKNAPKKFGDGFEDQDDEKATENDLEESTPEKSPASEANKKNGNNSGSEDNADDSEGDPDSVNN